MEKMDGKVLKYRTVCDHCFTISVKEPGDSKYENWFIAVLLSSDKDGLYYLKEVKGYNTDYKVTLLDLAVIVSQLFDNEYLKISELILSVSKDRDFGINKSETNKPADYYECILYHAYVEQ